MKHPNFLLVPSSSRFLAEAAERQRVSSRGSPGGPKAIAAFALVVLRKGLEPVARAEHAVAGTRIAGRFALASC
nr:MAG: hypothetical protein DIU78_21890 [Pseudomonadota bacterium]